MYQVWTGLAAKKRRKLGTKSASKASLQKQIPLFYRHHVAKEMDIRKGEIMATTLKEMFKCKMAFNKIQIQQIHAESKHSATSATFTDHWLLISVLVLCLWVND